MKNLLKQNSKKLKSCLSLDFFKIQQEIPLYGKNSYSSFLGVSVSYFQLSITCLAFFYFGRELIVKENPILIITENRLSLDNNYELDFEKEFFLNFGVFNNKEFISIDEAYFNIFGELKTYVPSNNNGEYAIKTTIFELGKCSLDYLKQSYGQDLSPESLQHYWSLSYCLSNKIRDIKYSENFPEERKNNTSSKTIKGFFGSREFSFINVKFSKCVNKTNQSHPVCKTPSEIDEKLKTLFLGGKVMNNFIRPKSYQNPINFDNEWFYSKISLFNKKQLNVKFQRNLLISDSGIFLTVEEPTVFYSLGSSSEVDAFIEENDDEFFFCVSLQFDKVEKIYSRRYKKIEDVFAQVGGLLKTSLIVFSIILKPFASYSFKLEILTKLLHDKKVSKIKSDTNFDKKPRKNISRAYDEFLKIIDIDKIIRYMAYTKKLLIFLYPPGKRKQFKRSCEDELKRRIFWIVEGKKNKLFNVDGSEKEINCLELLNQVQGDIYNKQIKGRDSKQIIEFPYVDESRTVIKLNEPIKINFFPVWDEASEVK